MNIEHLRLTVSRLDREENLSSEYKIKIALILSDEIVNCIPKWHLEVMHHTKF